MADALLAFRDGEHGEDARMGAMLIAEGLQNLQICGKFALSYAGAVRAGARTRRG